MKLKKMLAGTLVAAMVLGGVPGAGLIAFAETADDGNTSTAAVTYKEIDASVLALNAKDNSHANGSGGNDGAANQAFDKTDTTMWHQNYKEANVTGSTEKASADNPIWIQTSFGTDSDEKNVAHKIGKMTYQGRPSNYSGGSYGNLSSRISKYVLLAANKEKGTPEGSDWAVVKEGIMPTDQTLSELTFEPVEATHVRLVCTGAYGDDSYVCAGEIKIFEMADPQVVSAQWVSIVTEKPEHGSIVVTPSSITALDDRNTDTGDGNNSKSESASHVGKRLLGSIKDVRINAVPDDGYAFAGWKNIEKNQIVSKNVSYRVRETEVANYMPVFKEITYQEIDVLGGHNDPKTNPDNIRASSEMKPNNNNDGPAWYAFDKTSAGVPNNTTLWHENYRNNATPALGATAGSNSVYVEVKLSGEQKVNKITVTPRDGIRDVSRPKDYKILVANTEANTPADSDFVVVASGTFADDTKEKTIELPVAVEPSHIRIAIYSIYKYNNNYMSIANIGLYENTADTNSGAKVVAIQAPTVNDTDMGSVSISKDKLLEDMDTDVTLTATPKEGYRFVKWIVNDQSGKGVSEITDATTTVTMNGMNDASYQAMFAKTAEVYVGLDKNYLEMTLKSNGETVTQILTATVTKTVADDSVTWTSENSDVATVENGVVTAKNAGETTIKATSKEDPTKTATCTVVVHAAPSTETLNALLTQANGAIGAVTTYSTASRNNLQKVVDGIDVTSLNTTEEITAAESSLRTALENLVEIYKISVPNDDNIVLDSTEKENVGNDATSKWIYTPLFAKVSLSVKNATTDNGVIAGWVYGGKTVSTSTSYEFYVIGNMELSVTYTKPAKKEITLFCTSKYSTSAGKLSFIGKRSVPSDYKVKEHGIVVTDATGWKRYESNQNTFVKGATRTRKSVATGKANYGTYEAKLKCGKNEEWYGRSYVIYTDGYTDYTVYSKIERYPHN